MRLGVVLAGVLLLASWGAGDANSVACTCAHAAGVCIDVMRSLYGAATADFKGSPLTTVRGLTVRQCHLKALRNATFRPFVRLLRLDLSYCLVRQVEDSSLAPLEFLQELNLRGNLLQVVNARWFSASTALKRLDLSFNNVSALQPDAFLGLQSLETLNLSNNKLAVLPPRAFRGLSSLHSLDVSGNELASLPDGCFSPLTSLQRLNLSSNTLTTLGDGALSAGLVTLRSLDASRNQLTGASLQWLGGLADLSLADNAPLRRLLLTGGRLRTVDAARAGLAHIPAALTRSVRVLLLAGNTVRAVRCGDADSYPLLATLDLADNGLVEVEEDALGRLEFLAVLDLSRNRLPTPPRSLPSSLRTLALRGNPLRQLAAGDLVGLPRLEELSLQDCGLLSVAAGAFAGLVSLHALDLSQNPLLLPLNIISGPLGLVTVNMSSVSTALLNDSYAAAPTFPIAAPERIETLELEGSPVLTRLLMEDTATLAAAGQIRHLDLRNSGLDGLRSDLPHFFPRLKVLRLSGNPWNCGEDALWLAGWLSQLQNDEGAVCSSPPALAGVPLAQLSEIHFVDLSTALRDRGTTKTTPLTYIKHSLTGNLFITENSTSDRTAGTNDNKPLITTIQTDAIPMTQAITYFTDRSSISESSSATSTDMSRKIASESTNTIYSEIPSTIFTVLSSTIFPGVPSNIFPAELSSNTLPEMSTYTQPQSPSSNNLESSNTIPTDTSSTNPLEVLSTTPTETWSTIPTEASSTIPTEASSTIRTETSSTIPTEASSTIPMEASSSIRTETSSTIPTETSSIILSESSSTIPSETPGTIPTETSSSIPVATLSTSPSETSSTTTSETSTAKTSSSMLPDSDSTISLLSTTKSGRVLLNITVLSEGSTRGTRKADRSTSRVIRVIPAHGASNEALFSPQQPSTTGSHPGMFVLLAVGAAAVAALGAALPHLARRRARSYRRHQDSAIEVSAMSDLW